MDRPNVLGIICLVVVLAFAVGYGFYVRHVILEVRRLAKSDANNVYCLCDECIRCGCGLWERHHAVLDDVVTKRGR